VSALSACRRVLGLSLLFVLTVPAATQTSAAPTTEQIARWIRELGADDFETRENASKQLWQAGRAAETAVREAARSSDAEVSRRAQELADKFRWGIYPDTPAKVVELILRYQRSEATAKLAIVKELFDQGGPGCGALLKIVAAENDATIKQRVFAQVGNQAVHAVPALLVEGNFRTLEDLLELAVLAEAEAAIPSYVCYLLLRGRIDEKIAHCTTEAARPENKRAWEILAYLHRARGDLARARAAAEKSDKTDLVEAILSEQGDWKALARRPAAAGSEEDVEALGFRAAYQRLAGEREALDRTLDEIRRLADKRSENDPARWLAAKALFLNERPDEALAILTRTPRQRPVAVDILAAQLRFPEALALTERDKEPAAPDRPLLELLRGRLLWALGETDRARALFTELAGQIREGNETEWQDRLVEIEYRLGLKEQAREHCARILAVSRSPDRAARLLGTVFPGSGETAATLWSYFRGRQLPEEPVLTLKRVHELVSGQASDTQLKNLAQAVERSGPESAGEREALYRALAEAALAAGHDALGKAWLEKAAAVSGSAAALVALGDYLARRKEWGAAAEAYARAWAKEEGNPLPLHLRGHALIEAGKAAEGKKWIETAHLLPLGNEPVRHAFAAALAERGHHDAARRERELLLRISAPGSFYAGEALRQMAMDAYARSEDLRGAQLHAQAILRGLDARVSFAESAAYVGVPHLIHRHRARGLVAAGRLEEARREIALCELLLPGDPELPITLVPELEKRGLKKEADELFGRTFARCEKLCRDYPKSAVLHNAAAWLAACCRRNLDAALKQAGQAVERDPKAAYYDTLGEVHFQRGDKDRALAAARRSVELEPKSAYYRKQLKRIEAGDPKAPLPSADE
jgi:hypothetical protein